jgi:hypothetical protein
MALWATTPEKRGPDDANRREANEDRESGEHRQEQLKPAVAAKDWADSAGGQPGIDRAWHRNRDEGSMSRNVIAVITATLDGDEPAAEISRSAEAAGEVRVVVPAVEASPLRHTLGDVDEPRERAKQQLEATLRNLRRQGIEAIGEVGDPDPVQAVQDALLKAPADEVLFFAHGDQKAGWFEGDLFEHAKESLQPPLRMIQLDGHRPDEHVVEVERQGAGTISGVEHEIGSSYLPGLSRADLVGMVAGIVGTVAAAILAAIAAGGSSTDSGWVAAAILIAIGTALINMAHVVGLTLMEAVRYRGGFAKLFRTLSLVVTPLAVLANLAIAIFA